MKNTLWSFVFDFIKNQRIGFICIFLLSLTWAIETNVWPYLLKKIIDILTQFDSNRTEVFSTLLAPLLWTFILWTCVEIAYRSRDFMSARIFPELEKQIRLRMFDHIQHHSPKYFHEKFAGSLSNQINDMTTQISLALQSLFVFLPAIFCAILVLFFLFEVSPLFTLILGVWICLHIGICVCCAKKCAHYATEHGTARSHLMGKIVDSFTNHFSVNLFSRFVFEKSKIAFSQTIEQEKNYRSHKYVAKMLTGFSIVFFIGLITITFFSLLYWMQDKISTGSVVQVLNTTFGTLLILWVAGDRAPQFFHSIGIAKQALAVMQDPQDVLDTPNATPLIVTKGEVVFQEVCFNYGDKSVFHNKNIRIHGGEKVGIVGHSGSGKSTLINLLLRFHTPHKGQIFIDGQDILSVTLSSLRKQVALVPQDPTLFHRSILENIRYGNIDATEEEVLRVSKLAHCHEFILKFPRQYEEFVGERGSKLSGGERQRVAIARAMLTSAPILILDEATSALDSLSEKFVQEGLDLLMQGRTTIVIAHRLSTLSKMDRILVFDQGKIIEEGSHIELLVQNGHYAHMWHMQAGGFLH